MAECRITIIERSFRKEYVEQYVEEERKKTLGPCEVFTEGQTFIVDAATSGTICLEEGILLDIFTPYRQDLVEKEAEKLK